MLATSAAALAGGGMAVALVSTGGAATVPSVTAAAPPELTLGSSLTVNGTVSEGSAPLAGQALTLEASPYPYKTWQPAGTGVSASDGGFQIAAPPAQANERLRVLDTAVAGVSSATLNLLVDPRVALAAASLGPGRAHLSARVAHLSGVSSPPVAARWYVATRGSDTYHLAATTETHELPGAVTYASAIVDPPAKRFSYRVCLNPSWEASMGPAASHGGCPLGGFHLPAAAKSSGAHAPRAHAAFEFGGEGRGTPLAPFPSAAAIASAKSFLAARAGRTSFAVLDSAGHLSGLHLREHFQTASVVKVMFLTAYLQMLEAHHRGLGATDRALLYPMIHESNNDDASAVLAAVGGAAVARVAREAGMRDYAPGVGWWAFSQTSAQDQASFMMQLAHLIPTRFYGYARYLMATIEPEQSWGFPPVARPRWRVYFKTGALPSEGLFNEIALLEKGPLRFTVAVFTDGDPSMAYGEQTIEGVAERLLAGS
jgi:hypothetical protein